MKMEKLEYKISFLTPAFLGNAEQSAQWRTPPFKALLRQWWRVAYAADKQFNVDAAAMRREEGVLFGNAWLENQFCKSLVRIRLDHWGEGKMKKAQWPADTFVKHPEVKNREDKLVQVGSALYLAYGPLMFDSERRGTSLKANAAIQAGESATLSVAFPTDHKDAAIKNLLIANQPRLKQALYLMQHYGTVGGRSRNGWGSFLLTSCNDNSKQALGGHHVPAIDLSRCLDRDWPRAIGQDIHGALIWQTQPFGDWKTLMTRLADIKIGLRTQFVFTTGKNANNPEPRHWLSYPVTNHSVRPWGNNARLPNNLRFKVRNTNDGKLVGVIFHIPHLPPTQFNPSKATVEVVWKKVHIYLDAPAQSLKRIKE